MIFLGTDLFTRIRTHKSLKSNCTARPQQLSCELTRTDQTLGLVYMYYTALPAAAAVCVPKMVEAVGTGLRINKSRFLFGTCNFTAIWFYLLCACLSISAESVPTNFRVCAISPNFFVLESIFWSKKSCYAKLQRNRSN